MHRRTALGAVMLAVVSVPFTIRAQARLEDATAGVSLVPPPGWHVLAIPDVVNNRSQVPLPSPWVESSRGRPVTTPLFVVSKYPEPFAHLNPTVQVALRPWRWGMPTAATTLLRIATYVMPTAFPDFTVVDPVQDVEVSGLKAAYMKATYTINTAQGARRVLSRTWLVPRGPFVPSGSFMLLIGMSGAGQGDDVCESEFAAALQSIVIEK
jgi:hypothetical protein